MCGSQTPSPFVHAAAPVCSHLRLAPPPLFTRLCGPSFAQCLCWTGVLTTNNFWHACENSLWGVSPFILSVGALWAVTQPQPGWTNLLFLRLFCVMGPAFVTYLAVNDVPMYIEKWRNDIGGGVDLHPIDGLWDSMTCNTSRLDSLWDIEYLWMTGYFVGGVYISIQLEYMDATLLGPGDKNEAKTVLEGTALDKAFGAAAEFKASMKKEKSN